MKKEFKKAFLELFFPKFCFGCQKEKAYLCKDCQAVLDISGFHQKTEISGIEDLYFALEYKSPLLKNLVKNFKYKPFIKELSKPLASLITAHLQLLDTSLLFYDQNSDFVLIPVPLEKRKLKRRGFNQAREIAKEISIFLNLPLIDNALIKNKTTKAQVSLSEKERIKNIIGAFECQNQEKIKGKNVLLVDDIYTTGATMREASEVLKKAGAKKIIGMVIARAVLGQDIV